MDKTIFLVSCVAQKAATCERAADLYRSDWFRKARAYVESTRCRWFILSAEHGLLHPDTRFDPYDTTLAAMGARGRREWGARVARSEEHTSELQSLMRNSYAVFCLKKK